MTPSTVHDGSRHTSGTPTLVLHGAQVMDAAGGFSPATVLVAGATVVAVDRSETRLGAGTPPGGAALSGAVPDGAQVVDLTGRWLVPGVVDCHSHLGWTTFLHDAEPASVDRLDEVAPALAATLRAGVTSVRDAGGAETAVREALRDGRLVGPSMVTAVEMVTAADGGDEAALRRRVAGILEAGADWVKVVATGGVTAPEGTDLESAFTAGELRAVVEEAAARGARVMVHAWGGAAVTDAIAAGVASIEHGMFLTDEQAAAGAERGVVLVPTLAIYAEVAQMAARGELPAYVQERAERVVQAHPVAVRRARAAGMEVALGSDFGTTEQHGRNLEEIDHLAQAGLGAAQALLAATQVGARLLGTGSGVIEPGERFDAVVLTRDPLDTGVFRDGRRVDLVAAVYQNGRKTL